MAVALAPGGPRILARSDHASVAFGDGLGAEEVAYLHAAILRALVE
jgi:hypothetical protein